MSKTLYAGLNIEEESTLSLMGNSITVKYSTMGDGIVGMIPVYATREDAEKHHKNVVAIKAEIENE